MLWQKRALAKAGQVSQRCSADSTSSSQSRQRSESAFPVRCSHRRRLGWCPLRVVVVVVVVVWLLIVLL